MTANPAKQMLAFTDTLVSKEALLVQLRQHYDADEIIKGQYWQDGKGCAVGCTLHGRDHAEYETRFGIPQMLARLEDNIFEHLPNGRAKEWPIQFIEAVPVGADLSQVGAQFLHWLLVDETDGVIKFADDQGKVAIQRAADFYARQIAGETISLEDWEAAYAARSAAYAARSAARSAAGSAAYAAYAAYAAARSAAYAADAAYAAYAAWSAAYAADAAARSAARIKQADKLLELLRAAPVKEVQS